MFKYKDAKLIINPSEALGILQKNHNNNECRAHATW